MTPALSDHFNGKTFFQTHRGGARRRDLMKWKLNSAAKPWPKHVPLTPVPPPPSPTGDQLVVTWIGHATFLVQTTRGNLLLDPVFSERASPVSWAGPRRVQPPGMPLTALPKVDIVLAARRT